MGQARQRTTKRDEYTMTAPQTPDGASGTNGANGTQLLRHQLPNGLRILGQHMPDLESISVCFYARTGARDEHDPALYGVSHFLEHMVFKGTSRRNTEQITLDFNRMGAEFNAFTSVEQTVYYARILHEYLPRAVDLLSDMMRPRLDAHDFDMERNVILEEIARSEDVPTSQAYRRLLQTYFAGQPLGHDVLGTRESIADLRVEQMREYWGTPLRREQPDPRHRRQLRLGAACVALAEREVRRVGQRRGGSRGEALPARTPPPM